MFVRGLEFFSTPMFNWFQLFFGSYVCFFNGVSMF